MDKKNIYVHKNNIVFVIVVSPENTCLTWVTLFFSFFHCGNNFADLESTTCESPAAEFYSDLGSIFLRCVDEQS